MNSLLCCSHDSIEPAVAIDDVDDVIPARMARRVGLRQVEVGGVAQRDEVFRRRARVLHRGQTAAAEDEHAIRRFGQDARGRADDEAGAAVVLRPAGHDIVRAGFVAAAFAVDGRHRARDGVVGRERGPRRLRRTAAVTVARRPPANNTTSSTSSDSVVESWQRSLVQDQRLDSCSSRSAFRISSRSHGMRRVVPSDFRTERPRASLLARC